MYFDISLKLVQNSIEKYKKLLNYTKNFNAMFDELLRVKI